MKTKKTLGFTLIELMIVIAIIGILSSMVSVSLQFARMKARDAIRISDLTQIRTALEMYYLDHGKYPPATPGDIYNVNHYSCSNISTGAGFFSSWNTLGDYLKPYLSSLPTDPINTPNGPPWVTGYYAYCYGNVGDGNGNIPSTSTKTTDEYDLFAQLEDPLNSQRTGIRNYYFYFSSMFPWNPYTKQIYEASLQ